VLGPVGYTEDTRETTDLPQHQLSYVDEKMKELGAVRHPQEPYVYRVIYDVPEDKVPLVRLFLQ